MREADNSWSRSFSKDLFYAHRSKWPASCSASSEHTSSWPRHLRLLSAWAKVGELSSGPSPSPFLKHMVGNSKIGNPFPPPLRCKFSFSLLIVLQPRIVFLKDPGVILWKCDPQERQSPSPSFCGRVEAQCPEKPISLFMSELEVWASYSPSPFWSPLSPLTAISLFYHWVCFCFICLF